MHTNSYHLYQPLQTTNQRRIFTDLRTARNVQITLSVSKRPKTKVESNERKIMSSCHRPTTLKACPSPVLRHVYFTLVLQLKFLYQIAESQLCHDH